MIQEAVLEVRLLLQNGLQLSLCQKTFNVSEVFSVKGEFKLAAENLEKQYGRLFLENVHLADATTVPSPNPPKPDTTNITTQTDASGGDDIRENGETSRDGKTLVETHVQTELSYVTDKPIVAELLEKLGELEVAKMNEKLNEEEFGEAPDKPEDYGVGRRVKKRRIIRDPTSSEDEAGMSDGYASDSIEHVVAQSGWSKEDLQRVIKSLEQEAGGDDSGPRKRSRRKRGRPRKVQQSELETVSDGEGGTVTRPRMTKKKRKAMFSCFRCREVFNKRGLLNEHKQHCKVPVPDGLGFKCEICDKSYKKLSHLRRHQLVHGGIKSHFCSVCNKAFLRKEHMLKHELIHKVYKCPYCPEMITGKAHLARHERTHFPDEKLPPKRPPPKKNTPCRFCGKLYACRSECEQHERVHTNERPFKCSYCEVCFTKRGNALKHERRVHLRLKPFLCQYCGKAFAQKPDCKKHEMRHLGEKRVKCNYCDKMFLENHHRIVHERTHTGERPYKCPICNHAFAQSYDCKKHMRIHLKDKNAPLPPIQKIPGPGVSTHGINVSVLNQDSNSRPIDARLSGNDTRLTELRHDYLNVRNVTNQIANNIVNMQNIPTSKPLQVQNMQMQQQQHHQQQRLEPPPQLQHNNMDSQQLPVHSVAHQMYPMYDYQTISTSALNPDYMMQAVASSALHQMAPAAPTPVFAPHGHHDMQQGMFPPNTFDIRKMQELMSAQSNPDNPKLMP